MADRDNVLKAPFVKGRPVILLLHGYTGHKDYSPNTEIRPGIGTIITTISYTIYYNFIQIFNVFVIDLINIYVAAYLAYGEYNVISLDYHPLAPEPCYIQAVHNLPVVAKCSAQLLDYLIENKQFTLDDLHVIGFSLGAQTAGMIANYIKSGKLRRITGMEQIQIVIFHNRID